MDAQPRAPLPRWFGCLLPLLVVAGCLTATTHATTEQAFIESEGGALSLHGASINFMTPTDSLNITSLVGMLQTMRAELNELKAWRANVESTTCSAGQHMMGIDATTGKVRESGRKGCRDRARLFAISRNVACSARLARPLQLPAPAPDAHPRCHSLPQL